MDIQQKKFFLITLIVSVHTVFIIKTNENTKDSTLIQNMIIKNSPKKREIRFMCQQEGEVGGVVCQMYECRGQNCRPTKIVKVNNEETKKSSEENLASPTTDDSNLMYPESNLMYPEKESTPAEKAISHMIQKLENEIKSAEKQCERAESDPLEKEICERASANVQWRKEKIKALENSQSNN